MTNPYHPPESDIASGEVIHIGKKIGWKVFFLIMLPLEIWAQYDDLVYNEYDEPIAWLLFTFVIYMTLLLGLFGFAFNKRIFTARLWQLFLPVLIITDAIEIYTVYQEYFGDEWVFLLILSAIIFPLIFLFWYAIYRYSQELRHKESMSAS